MKMTKDISATPNGSHDHNTDYMSGGSAGQECSALPAACLFTAPVFSHVQSSTQWHTGFS